MEAAIRDNGLDVGIFSRGDRISKAEAGSMLDELRRGIRSIMLMKEREIEMNN